MKKEVQTINDVDLRKRYFVYLVMQNKNINKLVDQYYENGGTCDPFYAACGAIAFHRKAVRGYPVSLTLNWLQNIFI